MYYFINNVVIYKHNNINKINNFQRIRKTKIIVY